MIWPPCSCTSGENWISKDTCTLTFSAALLITPQKWKAQECPLLDEQKTMWPMYTMEYYSAIGKGEMMPLAATRMDLDAIILSEVTRTEKDKYYMRSLTVGTQKLIK